MYTDTNTTLGIAYNYSVTAVNSAGEGPASGNLVISDFAPPQTTQLIIFLHTNITNSTQPSGLDFSKAFSEIANYIMPIGIGILVFFMTIGILYAFISLNQYQRDAKAKKNKSFPKYLKDRFKKRKSSKGTLLTTEDADRALEKIEEILKENRE